MTTLRIVENNQVFRISGVLIQVGGGGGAHAIGGAEHTPSTLAELNGKISDATLDDSSASRPPIGHGASHIVGSSDIIDGDKLDITFAPVNYARDFTPPQVDGFTQLTAHLNGIDLALAGMGSGDVIGPGGATDNALVRFDTATGKLIQDSRALLNDAGDLALISDNTGLADDGALDSPDLTIQGWYDSDTPGGGIVKQATNVRIRGVVAAAPVSGWHNVSLGFRFTDDVPSPTNAYRLGSRGIVIESSGDFRFTDEAGLSIIIVDKSNHELRIASTTGATRMAFVGQTTKHGQGVSEIKTLATNLTMLFTGTEGNNASAEAFIFNADNALTTAGARIITVMNAGVDKLSVDKDGGLSFAGDLAHTGSLVGIHGATPVAQSAAYAPTNVTTTRAFDADATTLAELADVVGTLIADLQSPGYVGS